MKAQNDNKDFRGRSGRVKTQCLKGFIVHVGLYNSEVPVKTNKQKREREREKNIGIWAVVKETFKPGLPRIVQQDVFKNRL